MSSSPTRNSGRRVDVRTGRPAVLGLMVVALASGMFALAGTTPLGIGTPVQSTSQVTLDQRTFSCTGGISGTEVRSGSVAGGLDHPTAVTGPPHAVVADKAVAQGAFAGQGAQGKHTAAWLPCPEPQARWWFVGAGAAAVTHDTVLTLTNPRPGQALVNVDVFGPAGRVSSPGLHGITILSGATTTIDLAKSAPTLGNLAVRVVAHRGLVAVAAVDKYSPAAIGKTTTEWLPGQSSPSRDTTLAGIPANPTAASLVLVNPGPVDAVVKLQVIGTGTFAPVGVAAITVKPASTATVRVGSIFDGSAMALRVLADHPVTAALRSVQKGDIAFATGVRAISGATAFAVPVGGTGRVVLSSLGAAEHVAVTAYDAAGHTVTDAKVTVPARGSVGVSVSARVAYVQLVPDGTDVVAGFSVTVGNGIASAGVVPAILSIRLPRVHQGW
ncbi:MAG: hypothetical protein JWP74_1391 [Marmoricola sp.]|nr:hypothetical protein [Marmoricola sp.]